MDDITKTLVTDGIEAILMDLSPDFNLHPMYGGLMIEITKGDPKTRIGGFFVYKAHVSLEFTEGANLNDPKQILEGSGKYRRHIKLRSMADITAKDCRGFLSQAIAQMK